jgi:LPS O-antigen subunit length determinant protein (WzzB/FepE family)
MKKKLNINSKDSDLDLNELFIFFWDGKIKILLTILISIIIGIVYNHQNQEISSYDFSLDIKPSKKSEFIKFIPINSLLDDIDEETVYLRFEEEFLDYVELISVLKKNNYIKEKLSQIPKKDQELMLHSLAKSFILKPEKSNGVLNDFKTLRFNWHDLDEGKEILADALNITLINLRKSIFEQLYFFLEIKKNKRLENDLSRIIFLNEQRSIAYELNLAYMSEEASAFYNLSSSYYLQGFKAIDKEIAIINDRKYKDLANLRKKVGNLENMNINLVDYNLFLLEIVTKNTSKKKSFSIMAIFGLIIGMLFVFISNARRSSKKY